MNGTFKVNHNHCKPIAKRAQSAKKSNRKKTPEQLKKVADSLIISFFTNQLSWIHAPLVKEKSAKLKGMIYSSSFKKIKMQGITKSV